MSHTDRNPSPQAAPTGTFRRGAGFSLVELMVTIAVLLIMAAAAAPLAQSTLSGFRLKSSAGVVSGAISSTRFQAISNGYLYRLAFDKATNTYQISSDPTGSGTFTKVGGAVPFGPSTLGIDENTTIQFSPSGKVTFLTGTSPIVLTLKAKTGTLTVSTYGNVNVTYGS
jgi:prepilin-type N-terminal cleavage/methylation domain-containing protein